MESKGTLPCGVQEPEQTYGRLWRTGRPWLTVFSLRYQGHEGRAEGRGVLGHGGNLALAGLRCVGVYALWDGGTAVLSQVLNHARQLMGGGRDGFGGPLPGLHAPEKGAKGWPAQRAVCPCAYGMCDGAAETPNKGTELTAPSVRSYLVPASGSERTLSCNGTDTGPHFA